MVLSCININAMYVCIYDQWQRYPVWHHRELSWMADDVVKSFSNNKEVCPSLEGHVFFFFFLLNKIHIIKYIFDWLFSQHSSKFCDNFFISMWLLPSSSFFRFYREKDACFQVLIRQYTQILFVCLLVKRKYRKMVAFTSPPTHPFNLFTQQLPNN